MTLLERTQALEAKAKRRREQDTRGAVAEHVRARTRSLDKALTKLRTARSRADALENTGHVRSAWPVAPIRALAEYGPAGDSPISVESPRQTEWEKFTLSLGEFVKKVEKAVEQDIKRAKKTALDGISTEEFRGYQDDPSTEEEAEQLLTRFQELHERTWETLAGPALQEVLQQASALRDDVTRLRESGASELLRAFLAQARGNGAVLDLLTDPLRKELEERKLLGRLRLVLK